MRLFLIVLSIVGLLFNPVYAADNKIFDEAFINFKAHKKETEDLIEQTKGKSGLAYCQALQNIINTNKLTIADLDIIIKNTLEPDVKEAAQKAFENRNNLKTQLEQKYNNECSVAFLAKQENIRKRNSYVADYNRHLADANNYRREAFDILKRNGSQSYLCSAFRSELESLYNAHSALYKTFGLVPDLDYRGEATIKELQKNFDQNKLDIDAERC